MSNVTQKICFLKCTALLFYASHKKNVKFSKKNVNFVKNLLIDRFQHIELCFVYLAANQSSQKIYVKEFSFSKIT